MRKTLMYFILLVLLGYGVYYIVYKDKGSVFSEKEDGFNIKDTANIGKLFLADMEHNTILVERTDSGWYVNKQYKALQSTLNALLITLKTQSALYPVPEKAHNTVVKDMSGKSVKIEIYDRKGEKIRSFYVGGPEPGNNGSYMLMDNGAQNPYIVNTQAFQGYLTPRYTTLITDWRDRSIFKIPQADIRTITLEYPEHPLNSFTLKQENNKVVVEANKDIMAHNTFNERRASIYTKFFDNINCEGYMNGLEKLDSSIMTTQKYCSIDILDKNNKHTHAEIYWMPVNKRSKNLLSSDRYVSDKYDPDHYYATINNNKDTVLIQNNVFEPIFRTAAEFYSPDDTTKLQRKHPMMGPSENVKPKKPALTK